MIFLWFATRLGVDSKRFASVVLQGFLYEGGRSLSRHDIRMYRSRQSGNKVEGPASSFLCLSSMLTTSNLRTYSAPRIVRGVVTEGRAQAGQKKSYGPQFRFIYNDIKKLSVAQAVPLEHDW